MSGQGYCLYKAARETALRAQSEVGGISVPLVFMFTSGACIAGRSRSIACERIKKKPTRIPGGL